MYKYASDPNEPNPVTMMVSRAGRAKVVKQVKKHLLCRKCDQSLSKNGEDWMMRQVWNRNRFPLLDRLNVAVALRQGIDLQVYSGIATGIDTDKLAYFALSVLWRASVCEWQTERRAKHRIFLGTHQETLRKYLHGETGYPQEVSVMATVCTDIYSRCFYLPTEAKFPSPQAVPAFSFLALGVSFLVVLGPYAPAQICCVRSTLKIISKRDCGKKIMEAYADLTT